MTCPEKTAIERIKMASEMSLYYFKQPVKVCYSGGKDSEVIVELAKRADVPFTIQHSHTTIDAPQTVYHVRSQFKQWELQGYDCEIKYPLQSFWSMLGIKTTPPTRRVRWCCVSQKEFANKNEAIITGVRWDESDKRKNERGIVESNSDKKENRIILMNDNDDKRQVTDRCVNLNLTTINPIVDWKTDMRDDFIEDAKIKCNPLYCMGFDRIVCVGCVLADKKKRYFEFSVFPKYKEMYLKGFQKMLELRNAREKAGLSDYKMHFKSAKDIFYWFMEEHQVFGQTSFEEFEELKK